MLRTALNAPRRLARRLRFFADDADPTELPQKPPPVCVPRAARRAYADKLAEQRRSEEAAGKAGGPSDTELQFTDPEIAQLYPAPVS